MAERRKSKRHLKRVRIRLQYPNIQTFIEKYSANISRGGVFIQTREPKPQNTQVRFELLLANDEPALRGEGKVIWVKDPDPEAPDKPCGMGVKFTKVDRKTSEIIAKIIEFKQSQPSSAPSDNSDAHDEVPSEAADASSESESPKAGQEIESKQTQSSEDDDADEELLGSESSDEAEGSGENIGSLEIEDSTEQELSLELDETEENTDEEAEVEGKPDPKLQATSSTLSSLNELGPAGEAVQQRLAEALTDDSEDEGDEDVDVAESSRVPERRSSSPPLAENSGSTSQVHSFGVVEAWPPWMNEPIDVGSILGRVVGANPVAGEVIETELGELQPEGFNLSVTLEALVGNIAAAQRVIVAPRTIGREQPLSTADEEAQEPLEKEDLREEENESDEPVDKPPEARVEPDVTMTLREEISATSLAQVTAPETPIDEPTAEVDAPDEVGDEEVSSYELDAFDDDEAATELEMNAFSEAESDPSAYRREEDPTTNLYDLAREDDSLNALVSPEEFPDMMDELMMDDDEGHLSSEVDQEPSLDGTRELAASYDAPMPPGAEQAVAEFEEYELIEDEDISAVSLVGEMVQDSAADVVVAEDGLSTAAPDDFPVYTASSTDGLQSEADDALSELLGVSEPGPSDQGHTVPHQLEGQAPASTVDDLPPLFSDDAVEDETVIQQGPLPWDQGDGKAEPRVMTSATSEPTAAQPAAVEAGSQELPAPGESEVMVASELDHVDQTIFDPDVQQSVEAHDAQVSTDDDAAIQDSAQEDSSGKKKGFFRKLFGGGEG